MPPGLPAVATNTIRQRRRPAASHGNGGKQPMLIHHFAAPQRPSRAVVLGAAGFVGGAITARLEAGGVMALPLARRDLDLEQPEAGAALAGLLRPDDALIFVT